MTSRSDRAMRALHLFAGGGGSVITGRALGWSSVGAVEIDPFCCAVLEHHGERVLSRDVRTFNAARHHGLVDVVVGGWPCQGNSVAGKRLGLADDRSNLWWQLLRVLVETGARYLFAENVRGVLSVNGGRDFGVVLNSLADAGYDARWTVTRASDVGAPHRRERLWLFAWRRDVADSDSGRREQRDEGQRLISVADAGSNESTVGLATRCGRERCGNGPCGCTVADAKRVDDERRGVTGKVRCTGEAVGRGREGVLQLDAVDRGGEAVADAGCIPGKVPASRGFTAKQESQRDSHGSPQRRMGGADHGMAGWMDYWPAARGLWPSGRGEAQHAWEAPRVVEKRAKGDLQALKALGNGWVPSQAIAAWLELTNDAD